MLSIFRYFNRDWKQCPIFILIGAQKLRNRFVWMSLIASSFFSQCLAIEQINGYHLRDFVVIVSSNSWPLDQIGLVDKIKHRTSTIEDVVSSSVANIVSKCIESRIRIEEIERAIDEERERQLVELVVVSQKWTFRNQNKSPKNYWVDRMLALSIMVNIRFHSNYNWDFNNKKKASKS